MAVVPGFYQWVRFTPETTYGTFNGSGTPFWVRLEGDDGFGAQLVPARTVIRSADAWNRRVTNVSSRYAISANLRTPAYPSQIGVLMASAATLTGSTPPVISSYTADHFDGQVIRRYLGGVNTTLDLTSSADSQYADLATQWVFQKVDDSNPTTLPAPAETVFPSESPYLHTELAGHFTLGGTPITQFDQFHLTIRNTIAAKFYEQAFIAFAAWCGRDVDLTTHLTYTDTSWRGYFEAQTALTLVAEYFRSSTKNLTLDFKTVDIISDRSVSRPLGGVQEQGITVQAYYDVANTNDFSFTALYS